MDTNYEKISNETIKKSRKGKRELGRKSYSKPNKRSKYYEKRQKEKEKYVKREENKHIEPEKAKPEKKMVLAFNVNFGINDYDSIKRFFIGINVNDIMFKSKRLKYSSDVVIIGTTLNRLIDMNTILFRPLLTGEQKNKIWTNSNMFGKTYNEIVKWFKRFKFPYNLFHKNKHYKIEKRNLNYYFKIFLFDIMQEYMKNHYIKEGKYPWYVDIVIEPKTNLQFGLNSYDNCSFTTVYDLRYRNKKEVIIYRLFFDIKKIVKNKEAKDKLFESLLKSNNLFRDLSIKGITCKSISLKDYVNSSFSK